MTTWETIGYKELEGLMEDDVGKIALYCVGGNVMATGDTINECLETWNACAGENVTEDDFTTTDAVAAMSGEIRVATVTLTD